MGQAGMKKNWKRNTRYVGVFAVLAAVFCMIVVLNINTGNVQISVPEILRILFLKKGTQVQMNIIWKIRLPRVLMAGVLGGALALSGFLLQTFFSNPIAGPYVLGISSGAKMMVALAMIIFLKYYTSGIILCTDHCSIYRIYAFYRIYPASCKKDPEYGNPSGWRNHDRLYLLGSNRFCCDFCGGFRYRESARLVTGKLFRYELEQCKGGSAYGRNHSDPYLFPVKADRSVSAWEKCMRRAWGSISVCSGCF